MHSRQCSVIDSHNLMSSKCRGLEFGSDISGLANVAVWNLDRHLRVEVSVAVWNWDRTSEGSASVAVWNLDRTSEGPTSVAVWNLDWTPVGQSGGNQCGYCRVLYRKCALGMGVNSDNLMCYEALDKRIDSDESSSDHITTEISLQIM